MIMSFRRLYAGPVIICEYDVKERPMPYRNCGNQSCPRYAKHKKPQNGKFCTQCGSPVITFNDRTEEYIYPEWKDVDAAFFDAGLDSDSISKNCTDLGASHIYEPNQERGRERDFDLSDFSGEPVDMTKINIEAERQWLETAYATEIAFLKTLYVAVEVKWMILS